MNELKIFFGGARIAADEDSICWLSEHQASEPPTLEETINVYELRTVKLNLQVITKINLRSRPSRKTWDLYLAIPNNIKEISWNLDLFSVTVSRNIRTAQQQPLRLELVSVNIHNFPNLDGVYFDCFWSIALSTSRLGYENRHGNKLTL